MSTLHDATEANCSRGGRFVVEGQPERKPYEPPKLERRGKVERTTLISGNGCVINPGPGC